MTSMLPADVLAASSTKTSTSRVITKIKFNSTYQSLSIVLGNGFAPRRHHTISWTYYDTVPADVLVPSGTKTSASAMMLFASENVSLATLYKFLNWRKNLGVEDWELDSLRVPWWWVRSGYEASMEIPPAVWGNIHQFLNDYPCDVKFTS